MRQISLNEFLSGHDEGLKQAIAEPILLVDDSRSQLIVMSVEYYQNLIHRLSELEDQVFGQLAQANLNTSKMVGERFVKELQHLSSQNIELM